MSLAQWTVAQSLNTYVLYACHSAMEDRGVDSMHCLGRMKSKTISHQQREIVASQVSAVGVASIRCTEIPIGYLRVGVEQG